MLLTSDTQTLQNTLQPVQPVPAFDLTEEDKMLFDPEELEALDDTEIFDDENLVEEGEVGESEEESTWNREPASVLPTSSNEVGDSVDVYLHEIARVPLLSAEEERHLARLIDKGRQEQQRAERLHSEPDPIIMQQAQEARRAFVEANLRLVVSIAKGYQGRGLSLQDLIQEGNAGLLAAVDKFDGTRGYRFSTYATWTIRQAIGRAVANQARLIRLPVYLVDRTNQMRKAQQLLTQELGREPTAEEVARYLQIDPEKVHEMQQVSPEPLSLERPVGEEDDQSLADMIEDSSLEDPEDMVGRTLLKRQITELLGHLNERERMIIGLRYALTDNRGYSLEEIGSRLNLTRERVRQIETKAMQKLRLLSQEQGLHEYIGASA